MLCVCVMSSIRVVDENADEKVLIVVFVLWSCILNRLGIPSIYVFRVDFKMRGLLLYGEQKNTRQNVPKAFSGIPI